MHQAVPIRAELAATSAGLRPERAENNSETVMKRLWDGLDTAGQSYSTTTRASFSWKLCSLIQEYEFEKYFPDGFAI